MHRCNLDKIGRARPSVWAPYSVASIAMKPFEGENNEKLNHGTKQAWTTKFFD